VLDAGLVDMVDNSWQRKFDEPIQAPDGERLNMLREAVAYLAKTVPKIGTRHAHAVVGPVVAGGLGRRCGSVRPPVHNSIGTQSPPARLERSAASTIATPAKPSSIVGKVSAGSAAEEERRAMMAAATSL
jgi:hypothetical protein